MTSKFGGLSEGFFDKKADKKKEVQAKKDTSSTSRESSPEAKGAGESSEGWQGHNNDNNRPQITEKDVRQILKVPTDKKVALEEKWMGVYNRLVQAGMEKEANDMHKSIKISEDVHALQSYGNIRYTMHLGSSDITTLDISVRQKLQDISLSHKVLSKFIKKGEALLDDQMTQQEQMQGRDEGD